MVPWLHPGHGWHDFWYHDASPCELAYIEALRRYFEQRAEFGSLMVLEGGHEMLPNVALDGIRGEN